MENLIVEKNEMVGIFKKDFCIQGHTSKEVLEILEKSEQVSSRAFHRDLANMVIRETATLASIGLVFWFLTRKIKIHGSKFIEEDQE